MDRTEMSDLVTQFYSISVYFLKVYDKMCYTWV